MSQNQTEIKETFVPLRAQNVAARVVGGAALLVVLDRHQVHRLDSVGTRVWELCDGRTVAEVCDAMLEEYEVSREELMKDVQGFIAQLWEAGALMGAPEQQEPADG